MSKLFFCTGKKATIPYCMAVEHVCFFTIEELCYYICDRAEVLGDELMCGPLIDFVDTQLGLSGLAQKLEVLLREGEPLHVFCDAILEYAQYPDKERREQVIQRVRENETLPVVRRLQKQVETYMQQKRYYMVQKACRNMLQREDVQSDRALVAETYEKIGNAAALMFQYETAAYFYNKSCSFEDKKEVRKKYLLCYRFILPKEKYLEWVASRQEYYGLSVDVIREYEDAKQQVQTLLQENNRMPELDTMKEEFGRMVLE